MLLAHGDMESANGAFPEQDSGRLEAPAALMTQGTAAQPPARSLGQSTTVRDGNPMARN